MQKERPKFFSIFTLNALTQLSLSLSDDEMNDAEETARNKRGGALVVVLL